MKQIAFIAAVLFCSCSSTVKTTKPFQLDPKKIITKDVKKIEGRIITWKDGKQSWIIDTTDCRINVEPLQKHLLKEAKGNKLTGTRF